MKEGYYIFDHTDIDFSKQGNYLDIVVDYDGVDNGGYFKEDDECTSACVILGEYYDGIFREKYKYDFNISEGKHHYLIRCSSDYYWYSSMINAVKIETSGKMREVIMRVLEGD